MTVFGVNSSRRSASQLILCGLMLCGASLANAAEEDQGLLIDRQPFDRVTFNAANEGAVLDLVLLDLPNRQVPDPLPASGILELRQLDNPSVAYTVDWSAIEKVTLYEALILEEAERLANAGKSAEAFRSFKFLHDHYPNLPGLAEASERYVKREALEAFSAQRYDESLAILLSLYAINPEHRGLAEAVQSVSDRVITEYLSERDFAAARAVLELLKEGFPGLNLRNVPTWEGKFSQGAARELEAAQQAFDAKRYDEARLAVRQATDILPGVAGARELMQQIDRLAPQLVVGVSQLVTSQTPADYLSWSPSRVRRLTDPSLVEMVDFGAEGGIYRSPWVTLSSDDSGLLLDATLEPRALRQGITPEKISLYLLELSDSAGPEFQADFAGLFESVSINGGQLVRIHWRRPHVRPEALLRLSLVDLVAGPQLEGSYQALADKTNKRQLRYELQDRSDGSRGPQTIIERVFASEDAALAALLRGDVAVLDQVPPWQLEQLRADPRVAVGTYRLPTVHVLQPNYSKPLLASREFRRALCYGIDREAILRDLVLGGEQRAGFRVLSGPLPAGLSLTDPVGYAYNQQFPPRPYEPRLASVLATVAQAALAKKTDAAESTEEGAKVETPSLILAYPPNPVARVCCQSIGLQLTAVGIPVELKELPADTSELPPDYDLLYAELVIREPLVDARRLFGPNGSAGSCSPSMSLALEQVDQAKNWRQARERLKDVHQVAYYDLPVIPLWQTIDSFAYRKNLQGIGATPVTLYQNVADWRTTYDERTR